MKSDGDFGDFGDPTDAANGAPGDDATGPSDKMAKLRSAFVSDNDVSRGLALWVPLGALSCVGRGLHSLCCCSVALHLMSW